MICLIPNLRMMVELDLGTIEPSLAGPKRPQDRIRVADMKNDVQEDAAGSGRAAGYWA